MGCSNIDRLFILVWKIEVSGVITRDTIRMAFSALNNGDKQCVTDTPGARNINDRKQFRYGMTQVFNYCLQIFRKRYNKARFSTDVQNNTSCGLIRQKRI